MDKRIASIRSQRGRKERGEYSWDSAERLGQQASESVMSVSEEIGALRADLERVQRESETALRVNLERMKKEK